LNINIDNFSTKYPKAKKIAVENFCMSYDKLDVVASINLQQDAKLYKWNNDTINAIKDILKDK
jgi:hypothetical protein